MFAPAQRGPFFLFFVFVMAEAAYRWGLWETVSTAAAAVALLWIEYLAVRAGLEAAIRASAGAAASAGGGQLSGIESAAADHDLGLFAGARVSAWLHGAEPEKSSRRARGDHTGSEFDAGGGGIDRDDAADSRRDDEHLRRAPGSERFAGIEQLSRFSGRDEPRSDGGPGDVRWREAAPENTSAYLFETPAEAIYAERNDNGLPAVFLDREGHRLRESRKAIDGKFLEALRASESFETVVSVAFLFGKEWSGRVFLFDPKRMGEPEEELRFLQEFAQQVGPAIYNVYLMRRLRERAGAVERARFARELHDGAIQSLIAVEMQLDVLRRQSGQAPVVSTELTRIQKLLREEVLKLRELMQAMKSFEVDSDRLLGFISDMVERFQRETGVSAQFVSEMARVELPQKVCRELARIVQESLVNVRKHSGAHHVLVRLAQRADSLRLTVEDDGRGFSFSGRMSEAELATSGKGPAVIRERVRLLAGELTIESTPGQGARLEVRIPPARKATVSISKRCR